MAKTIYIKLGEKSPGFYDSYSGVKVSGDMVIAITPIQRAAFKVQKALVGGHLTSASEQEYRDWVEFEKGTRPNTKEGVTEPKIEKSPFDSMNTKALIKYYTEKFEVSEEDLDDFKDMGLTEKRDFLKSQEVED